MAYDPGDYAERHPAVREIMRWFEYDHLPEFLQPVSEHVFELAEWMVGFIKDSAELTAGLRKLLEAKDCFVRAALTTND